ncbi:MAG: carbohydrate porin [Filomicrobium sp.]
MVFAGRSLRAAALAGILITSFAAFASVARADCDVPDDGFLEETALSSLGPGSAGPGGVRSALAKSGIAVGGVYYGEAFANTTGGLKQGTYYDGVLQLSMNINMHKLGFWKDLCFHTNGFQIHGQSITAEATGSLMPVSNLEATPATRLFELWFEQHLFNDRLAVKVGQIAADAAYLEGGGIFLNGTWGWPSIAAFNLPSGGPAYPLATPGVRVAITPNDKFALLIGVYNGDPAGPNCKGDPQVCNNDGLDFRLDDPPLLMVEGDYEYNQDGLAGTIKIGGFNHFGKFEDQRLSATGAPRRLNNNYGLYGVIRQLIWRVPGSKEPNGMGLFGRVVGMPSDRNLIDFYADGGIAFLGMVPNRPDDSLAIGVAYTGISNKAHASDLNAALPVARNYEALLEICYTMQLAPGWTLQPDFQYIWQPGGNVPNASGKGAVGNAAVVGARTKISF